MILNSNTNYKDANYNFSQDVVHNNNINFRAPPYINYLNYNRNNNNNFMKQTNLFNNNNFSLNQYMNPYNQQMNAISNYNNNINNFTNSINNFNNNYNAQFGSKNYLRFKEKFELDCICNNQNYISKNELKQCIICNKYQHKQCINQAHTIIPYICFNCQFKYNHFYLRPKKTILPANEFIYKKEWEDDPSLLKEGTKSFEFYLDLEEIYETYNININNNNENNSYFLAILCLTNNGKPFHLGFPDNINISINEKKFYNTESKGFKRPLLLSIENNKYYVPKRRHLITLDKYEIPNAAQFFPDKNNKNQKITISFSNNLENYRGSEFEFVNVRHYLIYIGIFQEIKIPQMSLLRECKNLEEYFQIFKTFYDEKVKKIKWNKISNFISMDNDQLNMNMISEISNQRIICPVRGLFCQHTDVMDFGECCGYITSNNQVYKCFKCNKPLNIMYIDEMSEKIFNKYKNENYSQIYFSNKFKFIRGEKLEENIGKGKDEKNNIKQIENDPSDESLSESFFKYYENKINNDDLNNYENNENSQVNINEIIEINSDTESMLIEPNNIPSAIPVSENCNMNLESENRNESSNTNNGNNNTSNNHNDNSHTQDNIVVINNLDKSYEEIQTYENMENNNKENAIEENKNQEEIITLMEDDEDDEKENKDNSNSSNINDRIIDKEKEKVNMIDNSIQQNVERKSINNDNSESLLNIGKNIVSENDNLSKHYEEINLQKNKQNEHNFNTSKENDNLAKGTTNEFLDKKRNKEMNRRHRKKEIEKEKEIDIINSPKKRIFRRIENGTSFKSKNKNMKEMEYILEKEKEKENNNKNNINQINDLNDMLNNPNSNESPNNEQNNYLNVSIYNDIVNSNENNKTINKNKLQKNKSVIKNKRRNSDITSSSNNTQDNNILISEYEKKENNNNKRKRKNKLKVNKEKEKNNDKNNDENFGSCKNKISESSKNNNIILENDKMQEDISNNQINNKNKISKNDEDDYETILIDRKDLIEIKPYNEYKDNNRITNGENEEEFLNDFDIFENGLLDNNQMEFLNYDYYNIQRKLREYCSLRYQDDEIFNDNKTFFNKFK